MLSFLGGTGPEGRGLALRFALAGHPVTLGSRDAAKAHASAQELCALAPHASISAAENSDAARRGDIVFLTIPYDAQKPLLEQIGHHLAGKVVVNVIAPLIFEKGKGARAIAVPEGSAARQSQLLLPQSQVVAAFQNLSAQKLLASDKPMDGDVIVCSDHKEAKEKVMSLVSLIQNLRPIDGGSLDNARYVEDLTALILNINRRYKTNATIKILGV
ncbi:MAG: NADPH-dependent F420 reductase [SAR202 cluster bacterium]|nr:NADPH-dependent F420 reductase [SAR202 cluster bacterium]